MGLFIEWLQIFFVSGITLGTCLLVAWPLLALLKWFDDKFNKNNRL